MATNDPTLIDAIGYGIAKKFMFILFLVCSTVVWLPFILLEDKFPKLPLRTVGSFLGLICLVLSWLFSNGVVSRMHADTSLTFGAAFSHSFYAYLAMLCFLPFVGSFFQRFLEKKKSGNPFRGTQE